MFRVQVKPEMLRWARVRAGLSVDALEAKFPRIMEWESGDQQPTFRQLENLAKATHLPFGYFFLQEPLQEEYPIEHFRTVDDREPKKLSVDLLDTIYLMQRRQAWMREHLVDLGHTRLDFVTSAGEKEGAAAVAAKMRNALGISSEWAQQHDTWEEAFRALREYMEAAGIFVVVNGVVENNTRRVLRVEDFRGFVLVDEYAPFIFVNNTDSKSAQMFTLAHELAHVLYGHSASFDLKGGEPAPHASEQNCNRAAAEFLVPEKWLRQFWPEAKESRDPYQTIARKCKVSTMVAARRLLDARLIEKEDFFDFYAKLMDFEREKKISSGGGGNFYNNQNLRVGKRFGAAVVRAVRSDQLTYTEAYRLTGLWGNTFEKYAAHIGLGAEFGASAG